MRISCSPNAPSGEDMVGAPLSQSLRCHCCGMLSGDPGNKQPRQALCCLLQYLALTRRPDEHVKGCLI